jgi:hypothetical protein
VALKKTLENSRKRAGELGERSTLAAVDHGVSAEPMMALDGACRNNSWERKLENGFLTWAMF